MKELLPKKAKVYLLYDCSCCGCEWEFSAKEVRLLPGFVCSSCETYNKFKKIEKIEIRPVFSPVVSKAIAKKKEKVEKPGLTQVQENAILALVSIGFSKKESERFVNGKNFSSPEEYIIAATRKIL